MGRKRIMASTSSHRSPTTSSGTPACQFRPGSSAPSAGSFAEGGHQLEKLEFALAVAITRGQRERIEELRQRIADLGGNREEPGT